VRNASGTALVHRHAIGEPAAADEAEDSVADAPVEHGRTACDHRPADLEPGHVLGRAGRRGIPARSLGEIGRVERRVGRGDEHLGAAGSRVRPLLEAQLLAVEHDGTHGRNLRE
jgi:hypothetical protein